MIMVIHQKLAVQSSSYCMRRPFGPNTSQRSNDPEARTLGRSAPPCQDRVLPACRVDSHGAVSIHTCTRMTDIRVCTSSSRLQATKVLIPASAVVVLRCLSILQAQHPLQRTQVHRSSLLPVMRCTPAQNKFFCQLQRIAKIKRL